MTSFFNRKIRQSELILFKPFIICVIIINLSVGLAYYFNLYKISIAIIILSSFYFLWKIILWFNQWYVLNDTGITVNIVQGLLRETQAHLNWDQVQSCKIISNGFFTLLTKSYDIEIYTFDQSTPAMTLTNIFNGYRIYIYILNRIKK